jgi:tetratricopeptide (TPR) repeat protein
VIRRLLPPFAAAAILAAACVSLPAQADTNTADMTDAAGVASGLSPAQLRVTRLYETGNRLLNSRRYAEAERSFLDALKLAPRISAIRHGLGLVYIQTEDYELAVLHLEEALRLEPDQIKTLYALARAYGETGEAEKSRRAYERIIRLDPGFEKAYQDLAGTYYRDKDWVKALELLEKAKELNPASHRTLSLIGVTGVHAGRLDVALDAVTGLRQMGHPDEARRLEYLIFSSKEAAASGARAS